MQITSANGRVIKQSEVINFKLLLTMVTRNLLTKMSVKKCLFNVLIESLLKEHSKSVVCIECNFNEENAWRCV